ncbi:MAG: ABC transporter permease subunit [bacterium]
MSLRAIAGKELRDVLRERSIIVAVLVQFFIAAFSAFLTVGLLALYDPGSATAHPPADVAYLGPGGFDKVMDTTINLHVRNNPVDAMHGFAAGAFEAVVQESIAPDGVHTITIVVPDGDLRSTLIVTQMRDLLQQYEHDLRQANQTRLAQHVVELPQDVPRSPAPYPFVYATLLPLLLLTPVFLSGAIAGDAFTQEIQGRTLLLLRSSPISVPRLLLGKLLVPLALAPLQFLLWVALLWANGQPVANLPLLATLSTSITLVLTGIGYSLAARLRRDGPVQASYALVAIALGVASLFLPRDPLNLIARLATGPADATSLATLALIAAAGITACALGIADAARRIRRDLV